ncbi:hypothetical protein [Helicobacter phage FrGC43A]|nr:hypothetical protein [Helicobacter phage FrGC43A]PUD77606.1 hypothetical protein C2R64_01610 [Helicobacter pylori]
MFYPYFCVKRYLKHPTAKAIGLYWLMFPILNALIAMLYFSSCFSYGEYVNTITIDAPFF